MKFITCLSIAALAVASGWTPPAAAQSGGISDGVVKIGILTDMSGQFSHESGEGSVTAIQMAIDDFGGSVLGKPIELVVGDHQNKPDIAGAIARKWYDVEKVDMIANLINSSIALSVSQLAKDKNRIAIVNGSGSSRLTNDACTPNTVHYAYDTYALARGTGAAMLKAGEKTWFFLTADYAFATRWKRIRRQSSNCLVAMWSALFAIRSIHLTNLLSSFRRSRRRLRWLHWQDRERFSSTQSNRRRNSAFAKAVRNWPDCLSGLPISRAWGSIWPRAWC
jgi:hypothetical protein